MAETSISFWINIPMMVVVYKLKRFGEKTTTLLIMIGYFPIFETQLRPLLRPGFAAIQKVLEYYFPRLWLRIPYRKDLSIHSFSEQGSKSANRTFQNKNPTGITIAAKASDVFNIPKDFKNPKLETLSLALFLPNIQANIPG